MANDKYALAYLNIDELPTNTAVSGDYEVFYDASIKGFSKRDAAAQSEASITVDDGTAAAPSISFTSDTDTGFYRIGANNIGFTVNGTRAGDLSTTALTLVGDLNVGGGDIDAGASGAAGSVDIFPTTASKGKFAITCTDQTGNTTVSLVAGAMGQATTLTIADPGGSAANMITSTGVGSVQATRCTATISATSGTTGTTLTNVTGLTVPVLAAGAYAFRAYLATTSTANCGLKLAVANSGTTTSFSCTGAQWNGTTQGARTTTTTAGNAVAAATAVTTDATLEGTIVVNAAGNLTVQFAQNASHADTTSVLINSCFVVTRIA